MIYPARVIALCISCVLFSGCDAFESDRLTKLTGAKTEVERVYVCQAVYQEEAIRAIVLRNTVKSEASKAWAIEHVAEAHAIDGKFLTRMEIYSDQEVKKASLNFDKKFTQKEFTELFDKYERVLKAHCLELLAEIEEKD